MLFFFAPFVWLLAVPLVLAIVLLARGLLLMRSLGKGPPRAQDGYIEGEFVDDPDQKDPSRGPFDENAG
jgi:hypothetical protein